MDKDLRLQVILGAVNKMTAPMKAAQNSNRKLAQAIQSTKKISARSMSSPAKLPGSVKTNRH
ncbi:hypothetical protein DS682_10165 [Salmonella enterica subsp. diarizonae]|nr:hypothetical protein [Salmonella enterica subsp. diarizonae]EEJ1558215.1 hypothetical protein [Salmonella enterica subsp. houtenae]